MPSIGPRHGGCLTAGLAAAGLFALESAWIWFVVECVPVAFVEPTALECDPLPVGTRIALTLLAVPVALIAGSIVGAIVTRWRR